MNRLTRPRLSGIAVVLIVPLVLAGCQQLCLYVVPTVCFGVCGMLFPDLASMFGLSCLLVCHVEGALSCGVTASQACAENPDECSATFEQMELAAIQFCEEYPEECQQAFDSWVEVSEEEAPE